MHVLHTLLWHAEHNARTVRLADKTTTRLSNAVQRVMSHSFYFIYAEYAGNIGETADEKQREKEQERIISLLDQFQA